MDQPIHNHKSMDQTIHKCMEINYHESTKIQYYKGNNIMLRLNSRKKTKPRLKIMFNVKLNKFQHDIKNRSQKGMNCYRYRMLTFVLVAQGTVSFFLYQYKWTLQSVDVFTCLWGSRDRGSHCVL